VNWPRVLETESNGSDRSSQRSRDSSTPKAKKPKKDIQSLRYLTPRNLPSVPQASGGPPKTSWEVPTPSVDHAPKQAETEGVTENAWSNRTEHLVVHNNPGYRNPRQQQQQSRGRGPKPVTQEGTLPAAGRGRGRGRQTQYRAPQAGNQTGKPAHVTNPDGSATTGVHVGAQTKTTQQSPTKTVQTQVNAQQSPTKTVQTQVNAQQVAHPPQTKNQQPASKTVQTQAQSKAQQPAGAATPSVQNKAPTSTAAPSTQSNDPKKAAQTTKGKDAQPAQAQKQTPAPNKGKSQNAQQGTKAPQTNGGVSTKPDNTYQILVRQNGVVVNLFTVSEEIYNSQVKPLVP